MSWLSLNRRPTSLMPAISGPLMMSSGAGQRGSASACSEVGLQPLLAPFDHGAGEALLERQLGARLRAGPGGPAAEVGGERLDRLVAGLDVPDRQEDQRLGQLPLLGRDVGVARQLLGVDDGRVEPGLGAVVEEDRVEHLAAGVGQAEADVRDAEDRLGVREQLLDRRARPRSSAPPSRGRPRRPCRRGRPAASHQMSSGATPISSTRIW